MMPQAPSLPPEMLKAQGTAAPTNPINFLMAAAEAHASGNFQSAPVPKGVDLQSGKVNRKKHIQVVK